MMNIVFRPECKRIQKCVLRLSIFILCICNDPGAIYAQIADGYQRDTMTVCFAECKIEIDGRPEENCWSFADEAEDFWMKSPLLKAPATPETRMRVLTDGKYLYFAAWCKEIAPVIVQTLRRDVQFGRGDGISVVLDPVHKHTYGYQFGVSPYGVQLDGVIPGIGASLQTEWDGVFYAEAIREDSIWTMEMAIPLRTIRFKKNNPVWGVQFIRNVINQNEVHTWSPVPLQFNENDINYTGHLQWERPLPGHGRNIAIVPYVLSGIQKEPQVSAAPAWRHNAGIDAKIGVASALNLDLTFNPDFSQVEIDEQPVNLTRFNVFLPERRNFFLENRDIFDHFGGSGINLFFSRQIGLDESGRAIPILGGARMSGNILPKTRIGMMSMQTAETDDEASRNYSAIAIHQQIGSRSTIRTLLTNRQSVAEKQHQPEYNRTASLEGAYLRKDGSLGIYGKYHHAFTPLFKNDNHAFNAGINYNSMRWAIRGDISGAAANFITDMGFVPRLYNRNDEDESLTRLGFYQMETKISFTTYPAERSFINRHWGDLINNVILYDNGTFQESEHSLNYSFFYQDRRFLQGFSRLNVVRLEFPTSFVHGGAPIPPGVYSNLQGGGFFDTDSRKKWYFLVGAEGGGFYDGYLYRLRGGVSVRKQPFGSIALNASWNHIRLPDQYGNADIINITSKWDITMTKSLFWTTFLQYNTQAQVFNINSRIQWRFAPLSDLFFVYTDSYTTPDGIFRDRIRTFLIKFNYWWAI